MLQLWRRLTAAQINGISVALGVTSVQTLFGLGLGMTVGLAAAGGAVCASLADLPNPTSRVWPRLIPTAFLAALVTLGAGLFQHSPVAMTLLIAATAFGTLMTMVWGLRAGPMSFSGILALVFAMAWHSDGLVGNTPLQALTHAGWVLAGALAYALWARGSAWLLRRRYRELALARAMRACMNRLRSRAARIAGEVSAEEASIRASISDDVLLADALQVARDQIFAARPSPHSRRQVDLLLGLIELRDMLLASRLDVELLGHDAAGWGWRVAMAATQKQLANALEALAAAVDRGAAPPLLDPATARRTLAEHLAAVPADAADPRHHLVDALRNRVGHMLDDVAAMAARCAGPDREPALTPEQLRQFVSPEGWPLAALRAHLSLQSGVMRHALRATLALSSAYVLGLHLPWAAHPYWLVLSVAVVLRGNLEQTLARRDDRIIGTVMGCVLVTGLAQLHQPHLLSLAFLIGVGVAHAYVNVRYRVAATAATMMALLQPLLLAPAEVVLRNTVSERLADTVIGAALAWAFCFVLPHWERRSLGRLSLQLRGALARHAANVLRWAPTPEQQLAQRLSRQQAYTALAALAATANRTRVEPRHVRLPEAEIEAVLSHGYRLMALLGAVQQILARRVGRLNEAIAVAALNETAEASTLALQPSEIAPVAVPVETVLSDWPEHRDQQDLTPWLLRRLRICRVEAAALTAAVASLLVA